MNNTNALTFRQALNILEEQFDSTYRGISTVKEMTTDLMSAISFEGENPETIYHRFETKVGPNRIVKDDQIIALALHYVWKKQWLSINQKTKDVPIPFVAKAHYITLQCIKMERSMLKTGVKLIWWVC